MSANHNGQPFLIAAARWRNGKGWPPPGTVALVAAAGSLTACYGTAMIAGVLDMEIVGWRAQVQAVAMWGLGAIVLWALATERKLHGRMLPLAVGAFGVLLILFVLFVEFVQSLEILAYVALVMAALLNLNLLLGAYADQVQEQARAIRELNAKLEAKVECQGQEIARLDRLRQFLSPKVAELVLTGGEARLLDSHRRYIACLFCDIRHFSALTEEAEPEDTIAFLQAYHARVGELVDQHNGTIGCRAGDGLMVFFNDPIPCEQPVLDAVRLALAVRQAATDLCRSCNRLGFDAGIGIGIAAGYATLGMIGASGGAGYTAIGKPVNIAARLCDLAQDGEILIDQRARLDLDGKIEAMPAGSQQLKGVTRPVETYRIGARPGQSLAS